MADDDPPAHPGRALSSGFAIAGAATIAGAAAALSGPWIVPVALAGSGTLHLTLGLYGRWLAPGLALVATARDAAERGDEARALALLERAERRYPLGRVRVAAAAVRAALALARGDFAEAEAHASAALARSARAWVEGPEWIARVSTTAARALARAGRGDAEGAAQDLVAGADLLARARAVRAPLAFGAGRMLETALARLALAKAVTLARAGDRAGFRAHVAASGAQLAGLRDARERALFEGLQRELEAEAETPYRRDGARVERDGASFLESLLANDAAVEASAAATPERRSEATSALGRTDEADGSSVRRIAALTGGWVVLAALAFALNFLPVPEGARGPVFAASVILPALGVLALIAFAAWRGVTQARRNQSQLGDLVAAALAPGAETENALRAYLTAEEPANAAQAALLLARRANARGAFAEARAFVEGALARTQGWFVRVALFDEILPALAVERALAMAACGEIEAARRELAALPASFAHRAASTHFVELCAAVASGDDEAAARLCEAPPRCLDEGAVLLGDLVRATLVGRLGAGERRALHAALADERGAFLRAVAPRLVARLEEHPLGATGTRVAAVEDVRPGASGATHTPDELARAEEEAEAALSSRARRLR